MSSLNIVVSFSKMGPLFAVIDYKWWCCRVSALLLDPLMMLYYSKPKQPIDRIPMVGYIEYLSLCLLSHHTCMICNIN